ncbi:hypothetical protein EVAR_59530_1 [Eumeta japonica]|uniref:Uncharacterized protein n=1 Tax=Eumeta variegata TaxID=151549 RepID=A0A4C1XUV8_EUMVA|nr:hypothetical protein EVAR_59530_1 [Eumeta japonica]
MKDVGPRNSNFFRCTSRFLIKLGITNGKPPDASAKLTFQSTIGPYSLDKRLNKSSLRSRRTRPSGTISPSGRTTAHLKDSRHVPVGIYAHVRSGRAALFVRRPPPAARRPPPATVAPCGGRRPMKLLTYSTRRDLTFQYHSGPNRNRLAGKKRADYPCLRTK